MIDAHIDVILYVTGLFTASLFLQFLAPRPVLKAFNGLEVSDDLTLFFARAGALSVTMIGVLLIWAGAEPAIRTPVVTAATVGKAAFVLTILSNWSELGRGYLLTVAFDSLCVVIFAAYLLGA